ncbi:MAG: hypothetical protein GPOALKHO_001701 [Sodalis sp.]|nr:MAG: hypothetical protein GPOALKHO_001701 [Sodalis sp.]
MQRRAEIEKIVIGQMYHQRTTLPIPMGQIICASPLKRGHFQAAHLLRLCRRRSGRGRQTKGPIRGEITPAAVAG